MVCAWRALRFFTIMFLSPSEEPQPLHDDQEKDQTKDAERNRPDRFRHG